LNFVLRVCCLSVFLFLHSVFLFFPSKALAQSSSSNSSRFRFEISFPESASAKVLDGHILLGISTDKSSEPRFQLREEEASSAQFFGLDVDSWKPGTPAVIDSTTLGYPIRSLADVPPGDYYVQAVLNIYETFHRSDGHTVKLPPDMGEGQQWFSKPGNLLNRPQLIHIDSQTNGVIRISLTEKIPPIEPAKDTKYLKHIRIQSKLLSAFWGRPVYLGATVLLPEGFEEHPSAHYPLLVHQDHFQPDWDFFQEKIPSSAKDGELQFLQYANRFYQDWTSGRLPRMLLLSIQHANPYYDDSYAVNSANVGPYGDAITQELIPEVEKRFRGIGQPWARALEGGSTGGWEAAASQIFYPDFYNGAYSFCPDPIDFRAYQTVNVYADKNAFWEQGPFGRVPRAEMRSSTGEIMAVMEPAVRREEVMGTHGRSTEQFGIWQAVFGPVAPDGYPKPIWNPSTGAIDPEVAAYWKDHYDLRYILERDVSTLGPKLAGKLHFAVGDMDTWYLNNAVHLMQNFVDSPKNPFRIADFEYSPGKAHCYMGGGDVSNDESSGTVYQRIMPKIARRLMETAPAGADMSWKYESGR
jgi:enterochelin esterase-like enzyme